MSLTDSGGIPYDPIKMSKSTKSSTESGEAAQEFISVPERLERIEDTLNKLLTIKEKL